MSWMFEKGVDGVFVTGSYGAGPLMTNEERISLFKLAHETALQYSDKYVIAHVGCADTASTVALAIAAEETGVEAVGAVPPFYYSYTEQQVIGYYKAICDAVSIPVYAYNNPNTTKVTMTPDMIKKLQDVGVRGVKDSTVNVNFLTRVFFDAKYNNKDFHCIIGTSNGWIPFCLMGIDTMIAGMCNYAPEIVTRVYKYTQTGETEKAERAYQIMQDYLAKCRFADSTQVSHCILRARGFDCGDVRRPMTLLPEDDPKCLHLKENFDMALEAILGLE